MSPDLGLERLLDAPPGEVFKAFTDPEAHKEWFARSAELDRLLERRGGDPVGDRAAPESERGGKETANSWEGGACRATTWS